MPATSPSVEEETLDPTDWEAMEVLAHRIVKDAVVHIRDVRDRPVWREMPENIRQYYSAPMPTEPSDPEDVYKDLQKNLMPYPMGNIHPRFWMWYMGAGSFTGALAEFLAAVDGSNLGGGSFAGGLMDIQVIGWLKQMMGFPKTASGTLVSGGSMANILGLTVARNAKAGIDVRSKGVAAIERPLSFYASDQVHSCNQKAMELLGLGNEALRRVPSNDDLQMNLDALRECISRDRRAGRKPACVIATAGTVNTGAIDNLQKIANICAEEDLWFHVDGCIGALVSIAPLNKGLVTGLERADSIALDPHKWLHVPFEAGCALIRDADLHRGTFAVHPEYLEEKPRGIAAAEYLQDYNLQTSRGFRALKIWFTLKQHGAEKFGRLIDQNIAQAQSLTDLLRNDPDFELVAPTILDIVCFRYIPEPMEEDRITKLNTEIMLRLQEGGIAAISDTTVHGRHCLRVAICNHRTRSSDLDLLVRNIKSIGSEVLEETE